MLGIQIRLGCFIFVLLSALSTYAQETIHLSFVDTLVEKELTSFVFNNLNINDDQSVVFNDLDIKYFASADHWTDRAIFVPMKVQLGLDSVQWFKDNDMNGEWDEQIFVTNYNQPLETTMSYIHRDNQRFEIPCNVEMGLPENASILRFSHAAGIVIVSCKKLLTAQSWVNSH